MDLRECICSLYLPPRLSESLLCIPSTVSIPTFMELFCVTGVTQITDSTPFNLGYNAGGMHVVAYTAGKVKLDTVPWKSYFPK